MNSPPPLTSQTPLHPPQNPVIAGQPGSAPSGATSWQQLTPVLSTTGVAGGNPSVNGLQNGAYTPDLVARGLMVSKLKILHTLEEKKKEEEIITFPSLRV